MNLIAKKIILFYNTIFDEPLSYPIGEIPDSYIITTDKKFYDEAVAVVFHLPSLRIAKMPVKQPGQLWVIFSMESVVNYPLLVNPDFMKYFEITMTYQLDTDVITSYIPSTFSDDLNKKPMKKILII